MKWVGELWTYRELVYFLVWRDIKIKYKQSLLGVGWALLQPLMAMLIFTLFFGRLAKVPSDGLPYPVFSYAGLLPWTYFSASLALAGNSLISNSNMLTKVYFPRVALPLAAVISGLLDFAVASILLVVLMLYYNVEFGWTMALIPVLTGALLLLASGVGMFFAAVHVRYRDVKYALPFLIQLWMFVTPVIYPLSMIPEKYRPLVAMNPAAGIVDAFRGCVSPARGFDLPLLGISLAVSLIVFVVGILYFRKTERWIADII